MGIGSKADEVVIVLGHEVPTWFSTVLYRPDVPYSVTVMVRVNSNGDPIPVGVTVNDARPDSELSFKDAIALLKGAPMEKLMHEALLLSAKTMPWQRGLDALGKPTGAGLTPEEYAGLQAAVADTHARIDATPPPVRRRLVTREHLVGVAKVYRKALAEGVPPTKAVAEHFTATHSSAARWVREARKEGILGPSKGPTAGEG